MAVLIKAWPAHLRSESMYRGLCTTAIWGNVQISHCVTDQGRRGYLLLLRGRVNLAMETVEVTVHRRNPIVIVRVLRHH